MPPSDRDRELGARPDRASVVCQPSRVPTIEEIQVISALGPQDSPARTVPSNRGPLRIAAVQQRWHPDPVEHQEVLAAGIALAARKGARIVCLQELTLSRYFAVDPAGPMVGGVEPEDLDGGATHTFAASCASNFDIHVHASLFERADGPDGLGFNTAIVVAPGGEIVARTRKLHIPVTVGYHEDRYFRPGPAGADAFRLFELDDARLGFPTCWDQWFPELARAYGLAGADVLIYPTAIGSEPDHPGFDTEPLWERVITANGIANGLFMVAVNRFGEEPPLRFYGSSFISDPYGRKLVQAPRDAPALLLADIDLDQRRDWLELFPFLTTRRPDAYGSLADPRPGTAG